MARKFLTAIDLAQNELQNPRVHNVPGTTGPPTPVKGQLYFDSTGNVLYWWNGTVWVAAQGGAGVAYGTITQEQTFGAVKNDGVSTNVARADHGHGNPTHVNADHAAINLSALAPPTADVSMGGFKITSLGVPVSGNDATNKTYVDNLVAGLSWKDAVQAATTVNITLSGVQTIDFVSPSAGERVLVKNQTAAADNGIYVVSAGAWTRATDADASSEVLGMAVFVHDGNTQGDTAWACTNSTLTLGTTSLVFAQIAGGTMVTAGAGMTQSGNVLNVIGDASATIEVTADQIRRGALTGDVQAVAGFTTTLISPDAVTNLKLGIMPAHTFKGNNTGSSSNPSDLTVAQMKTELGLPTTVVGKFAAAVAAATSSVINHLLNTRDVAVDVYRVASPYDTIECDVERTDVNNVTVRFAVAPAAGEYRVVVTG